MAVLDKTTFEGTHDALFADNTTQDIEAVDLRTFNENIADSTVNKITDGYTNHLTATGTDTYAGTTVPTIPSYATGQKYYVKFTNASTGVSTLNLNSIGAKKIFTNPTTQATTGDITAAQTYLLIYDAALDTAAGGFLMIGGSGGGGHTIEDEGTPLTQRTKLNFVGAGVTVTDDGGDDASVVTISGTAVPDADATTKGIAKLYPSTSLGSNTDGAPDQNAVKAYVDAAITDQDFALMAALRNLFKY